MASFKQIADFLGFQAQNIPNQVASRAYVNLAATRCRSSQEGGQTKPTEAMNGKSNKRSMGNVVQRFLLRPHLNARLHCVYIGLTVTSTS